MTTSPSDRRVWPRMALDATAVIRIESLEGEVRSRILNASRHGLLLAMPSARSVGTRMHITVQVRAPKVEIVVSGIVAHVFEAKESPPGFEFRVGVYLTKTGHDWGALYRQIARGAVSEERQS